MLQIAELPKSLAGFMTAGKILSRSVMFQVFKIPAIAASLVFCVLSLRPPS
jgi:hypothetical protein